MKIKSTVARAILSLTFATTVAVALALLAAEITVAWYMHNYAIAQRVDLSDDFGFGMLVSAVMVAVALVSGLSSLVLGWRLSDRWLNRRATIQGG